MLLNNLLKKAWFGSQFYISKLSNLYLQSYLINSKQWDSDIKSATIINGALGSIQGLFSSTIKMAQQIRCNRMWNNASLHKKLMTTTIKEVTKKPGTLTSIANIAGNYFSNSASIIEKVNE
jgi:hypothetical protein